MTVSDRKDALPILTLLSRSFCRTRKGRNCKQRKTSRSESAQGRKEPVLRCDRAVSQIRKPPLIKLSVAVFSTLFVVVQGLSLYHVKPGVGRGRYRCYRHDQELLSQRCYSIAANTHTYLHLSVYSREKTQGKSKIQDLFDKYLSSESTTALIICIAKPMLTEKIQCV